MNEVQLKDIQNVQFTNWISNSARVEIDGQLKSIRFKWIKNGNNIKCVVTKGLEHCIF